MLYPKKGQEQILYVNPASFYKNEQVVILGILLQLFLYFWLSWFFRKKYILQDLLYQNLLGLGLRETLWE